MNPTVKRVMDTLAPAALLFIGATWVMSTYLAPAPLTPVFTFNGSPSEYTIQNDRTTHEPSSVAHNGENASIRRIQNLPSSANLEDIQKTPSIVKNIFPLLENSSDHDIFVLVTPSNSNQTVPLVVQLPGKASTEKRQIFSLAAVKEDKEQKGTLAAKEGTMLPVQEEPTQLENKTTSLTEEQQSEGQEISVSSSQPGPVFNIKIKVTDRLGYALQADNDYLFVAKNEYGVGYEPLTLNFKTGEISGAHWGVMPDNPLWMNKMYLMQMWMSESLLYLTTDPVAAGEISFARNKFNNLIISLGKNKNFNIPVYVTDQLGYSVSLEGDYLHVAKNKYGEGYEPLTLNIKTGVMSGFHWGMPAGTDRWRDKMELVAAWLNEVLPQVQSDELKTIIVNYAASEVEGLLTQFPVRTSFNISIQASKTLAYNLEARENYISVYRNESGAGYEPLTLNLQTWEISGSNWNLSPGSDQWKTRIESMMIWLGEMLPYVKDDGVKTGEIEYAVDQINSLRDDFPVIDDNSMVNGGIDANIDAMGIKTSKDAQGGVRMEIDPAMIERVRKEGINSLTPIIFNREL
ncbi:MAG: hypothetical protein V2A70_00545 [Candidatus Omnitrophota bacterium]